jgi:3-dehydroquinate synthase
LTCPQFPRQWFRNQHSNQNRWQPTPKLRRTTHPHLDDKMMNVRVNLGDRSYDIAVAADSDANLGLFARGRSDASLALVVMDDHVQGHARKVMDELTAVGIRCQHVLLPPGEELKCLVTVSYLYDLLADLPADRKTLVVPVGGGVLGDLAGFVAATYARGLPLLMVPTSLLAMIDSSVGGKVGVNHPKAKNLIGAFHQPVGVWIDIGTLATLPDREYRSGLAEVVKYGVILDADLFAFLETRAEAILRREPDVLRQIITRCCRLKADIVEKDEREVKGLRVVLNYGHTFAHAIETLAGYGTWLHGEAVSAGMVCASRLAEKQGLIRADLTERQQLLLKRFGLPTSVGKLPAQGIIEVMRRDKKSVAGRLRFILPRQLGEVALFDDVSEAVVKQVLEECHA